VESTIITASKMLKNFFMIFSPFFNFFMPKFLPRK